MKKLPNFTLSLIDGSILKSSAITSKTILFFYPKAMTPGCTVEVNEFQSNLNKFQKLGFTIIGCSKDSIENNIKFAEKYKLRYLLGSDLTNVCEKLGIWIEKSMYGKIFMGIERSTFLIDEEGKISKIWRKVKVAGHAEEVFYASKEK